MAREKFTVSQAHELTAKGMYGAGDGLYLQVTERGTKSWVYRFKEIEGGKTKQRYIGLGGFPETSISEARRKAGELRQKRENKEEVLPARAVKAQARVASKLKAHEAARATAAALEAVERERVRADRTLRDAVEDFILDHAKGLRNDKHAASYTASMEKYVFPLLGDRPLQSITKHDIAGVIRPMVPEVPETASKVQNRLHRAFVREIAHDRFEGANPADKDVLKAMGVFSGQAKGGNFDALPYRDVPRLWAFLKGQKTIGALCLRFLLLTCVRSREVRGANWSELDLEAGVWTVPAERMKMGEAHRVPLSPAALEVLAAAKPWRLENGLIFPGRHSGDVMTDMTLLQIVKRLEGCKTTVHGLRSSFRDWAAEETEHDNHVAEMALAHVVQGVEGAYRRGDLFKKRRALMDDWAAFVTRKAEPFKLAKRKGPPLHAVRRCE